LNGITCQSGGDLMETFSVLKILAQRVNVLGMDVSAAVFAVLPALVFDVWAELHGLTSIRGWFAPINFGESSKFDRCERGEFFQCSFTE
jgi:hypothetical protein